MTRPGNAVVRFIGDEQVERPNAKNHLGLTLIATAVIRLT
jgi:hypothetical protein